MKQIVRDYQVVADPLPCVFDVRYVGVGCAIKSLIADLVATGDQILDVGFGRGNLGRELKLTLLRPFVIDGIDGAPNVCANAELFEQKIYRNVWWGMLEELTAELVGRYDVVCMLDVLEHLSSDQAPQIMRRIGGMMKPLGQFVVSTPLWCYPQDEIIPGDLERHRFGITARDMLAMKPVCYSITDDSAVGMWVLDERSVFDAFTPITDLSIDQVRGREIIRELELHIDRQWHYLPR